MDEGVALFHGAILQWRPRISERIYGKMKKRALHLLVQVKICCGRAELHEMRASSPWIYGPCAAPSHTGPAACLPAASTSPPMPLEACTCRKEPCPIPGRALPKRIRSVRVAGREDDGASHRNRATSHCRVVFDLALPATRGVLHLPPYVRFTFPPTYSSPSRLRTFHLPPYARFLRCNVLGNVRHGRFCNLSAAWRATVPSNAGVGSWAPHPTTPSLDTHLRQPRADGPSR